MPGPVTAGLPDDAQTTRCTVEDDQARPLLVEWPAADKASLEAQAQQEVVVVAYEGCRLRLLPGCGVAGTYEFRPTSPARDRVEVRTEDELYAKLPLGAVSLEGELRRGNTLSVDYVVVGQRRANVAAVGTDDLGGASCEGATHWVRAVVVGAYELTTRSSVEGEGGVSAMGVGTGAGGSESSRVLRQNGDLAACSEVSGAGAGVRECQSFVQLDLAAIRAGAGSGPSVDVAAVAEPDPDAAAVETPAAANPLRGGSVAHVGPDPIRREWDAGGEVAAPEPQPSPAPPSAAPAPDDGLVPVHIEVGESGEGYEYRVNFVSSAGPAPCSGPVSFMSPCSLRVPRGSGRLVISGTSEFSREFDVLGGDRFVVEEGSHAVGTVGWVLAPIGLAGLLSAVVFSIADVPLGQILGYSIGGALATGGVTCLIVEWAIDHGSVHRPDELPEGQR